MDTLFLIASKTVWFFLRPETMLLLLFVLPYFLLRRERVEAATRTLSFALSVTVLIGLFPVGNVVLNPLERAYPVNPEINAPAGIIVLGGMEDIAPDHTGNVAQVNDAAERLIVAYELARRFPEATVLYSGGKLVFNADNAGGFEVGPDILRRLGLPEERLIVEGRSRTTAENATLSREMVPDQGTGPWVLVTSAFHMPRALGSFCAAGWRNLIPYPVDYRGGDMFSAHQMGSRQPPRQLNIGVKEWIGLLAYKLTGRTTAFFPKGCP